MQLRASDLWQWDGTLDRGSYAVWGCLLFALKYNLDRLVAAFAFGRAWSLLGYLKVEVDAVQTAPRADLVFWGTLVAMALPFIYVGIVMTLRRLRSAGLPVGTVALFFVPMVNLLFFLVLSVLPAQSADQPKDPRERLQRFWHDLIPHSALGSAALGLVVSTTLGSVLTVLAVNWLRTYGFGLFLGLPFAMGLISVLIYGYHEKRSLGSCLTVSMLTVGLLGAALLAAMVEGVICLMMAAPIGLPLAALGGAVGYLIVSGQSGKAMPQVTAIVLLCLPGLMGAESLDGQVPTLIPVTTSVEVEAPPERVWPNVIAFGELPAPTAWIFKTGIAYPQRARIMGHGVGAVRRCEFSTGPFVEPITVWDAPHRLAFDVVSQPRSMNELSPWGAIAAPHIDHFLVSEHGEFRLTPLAGGRTRLEGTTWYRHRIWPETYWRVWSDAILHRIHLRVLAHVKHLSEKPRSIGE